MTRDDAAAAALLVVSAVLMAVTASRMPDRWPWIWITWASALPFLTLLAPAVQERARTLVTRRPEAAIVVPMLIALAGLAIAIPSGLVPWLRVALWPATITLAVLAVGTDRARAPGGWRLIAGALALGVMAGIWDRALKIPVPGGTQIGFTFFAAVGFGIWLYRAVRPLETLDVGAGLSARHLGLALGVATSAVAIAVPVGYVVDFVVWNPRLTGTAFGMERLLGLIVFIGIPEEILFRGLIQEGLSRLRTPTFGWIAGSLLFGVAHLTKHTGLAESQRVELMGVPLNWRYALMATLAGLAYGWVYRKTGRISAAAVTHGVVDWTWSSFFGR